MWTEFFILSRVRRSIERLGHSNDVGGGYHSIGLAEPFSQLSIDFAGQFRDTTDADERQEKHQEPVDVEEIDALHIGHHGRQANE